MREEETPTPDPNHLTPEKNEAAIDEAIGDAVEAAGPAPQSEQ